MKHMLYFFSVSNLINKSSYIPVIICNVKMGLFKFSTNIFIHEYTVNAGNVSSYDSLSRHVGLAGYFGILVRDVTLVIHRSLLCLGSPLSLMIHAHKINFA